MFSELLSNLIVKIMLYKYTIVYVIKLKVKWLLAVLTLLNVYIQCIYVLKSLHSTKTVEMMLHHHFIFKSNTDHSISNYNAAKIDSLYCFYIYTYKAVTFQILYYLLNTMLSFSFISHHLVFTEHLRTLYLLSFSL